MKLKGNYEVTVKFTTIEDVPEGFEEKAKELIVTQDFSNTPVQDNFKITLESEFGAENVEVVEFKLIAEDYEGE